MAHTSPVSVRSMYYTEKDGRYVCGLCPHACRIEKGGYGRCGSRYGEEDFLRAYTYGRVSSIAVDPMEKKPVYHFRPGGRVFSVGGVGCNMTCRYCQNYYITQSPSGRKRSTYMAPEDLAHMCRSEGWDCIAFTYNEPVIWLEYILDVMKADPDLTCVIVSNGLINQKPLKELCKVADAFNIDLKGYTDEFYRDVCGGNIKASMRTMKTIFDEGVHLEITYLLIPGHNDSDSDIRGISQWIAENLSPDVPLHFTRFHPDNEMEDVPWTPEDTMYRARRTAMECGLRYVYLGNILTDESDTVCPECGATAVRRVGYSVDVSGLDGGRCARCGHDLGIIR